VLGRVRSGDVVLMHDGGGIRAQTVAALGTVLSSLSARGFRFAALCRG
jgi:peptidoglycan/xylan/chitin deacetylase (PgdA/CDA1 family)